MKLLPNEEIRDIEGYEGLYAITSLGRVWSYGIPNTRYKEGRFKKLTLNSNGYIYVGLNKDKKLKTCKISRLVAKAFILNPLNKLEVNHIDGDKKHNSIHNLEWVTSKENSQHSWDTKLSKPSNKQKDIARRHCKKLGKISGKINGRKNGMKCKVLSFAQDEEIRKKYKNGVSIRKLAAEYMVSCTPIRRAIKDNYVIM